MFQQMNVTDWNAFWAIFYPLVIAGLIFDHYFLGKKRTIDYLVQKAKDEHRCMICQRPMAIQEDEVKTVVVMVNGKSASFTGVQIAYEDVAAIAKVEPTSNPSVVWRKYKTDVNGILRAGQKIPLQPGLVFQCLNTGNA